jgi:hypothetical protein
MQVIVENYKWLRNPDLPITLPGFEGIHSRRWTDPYDSYEGSKVLLPREWREKDARDRAYIKYLSKFVHAGMRPKILRFQAIRILGTSHADGSSSDWWREYKDAIFRVWQQPHTNYDLRCKDHVQWYVLSPEDAFLVHCLNHYRKGLPYPKRSSFRFIPPHPEFRKMLLVPTECCHHMRHETTAGLIHGFV